MKVSVRYHITQGNRLFSCWMMDLTDFNLQTACYHYDWICAPVIFGYHLLHEKQ